MGRPSVSSTVSRYQYHIPPENGGAQIWKGPRKVATFCLLAVILPCILVSVALLMRFVVHGNAIYHVAPSDMRILDHRISTIWCQSEMVKGNTSFTAYLSNGEPELIKSSEPVLIERNLIIPDDHKEYWGFYLLKGSTFRVYTCARFKGGTLLIVRGRNHLEHCAYIGEEDSAGNSDEFSNSNSREGVRQPATNQNSSMFNSNEEMGVILSKIRQYIRSRPQNYSKLKKNLANWMLLKEGKSLEDLEDEDMNNSSSSSVSIDDMPDSAINLLGSNLPEDTQPRPLESVNISAENNSDENVIFEHGTILRNRRQTEIRKHTESGENGAFEEEDPIHEHKRDLTNTTGSPRQSIWSQEHGDHHGVLNDQLNSNDGSNSESESSWSSSEEAMAKCEGVLASFNLKANDTCGLGGDEWDVEPFYEGYVNVSGYYYFIFGSENEKRDNIIRARFQLEKFIYHLPQPIGNCTDVKDCRVNFTFASNEKLVITVPQPPPNLESVWNENYVAESECLPRTSVYLIFVILVPLVILLCAFQ